MYFAVHVLPPGQRRDTGTTLRTLAVSIDSGKTFADLLRAGAERFDAACDLEKPEVRVSKVVDKVGAEFLPNDKICAFFEPAAQGPELYLQTVALDDQGFTIPPKPSNTSPATTQHNAAPTGLGALKIPPAKRRRIAPPTPDSAIEVRSTQTTPPSGQRQKEQDPIEEFDEYELPGSQDVFRVLQGGSSRKYKERRAQSAQEWTVQEDAVLLKGMKQGWTAKAILARLPKTGNLRTESAVRGRKLALKKKHGDKMTATPIASSAVPVSSAASSTAPRSSPLEGAVDRRKGPQTTLQFARDKGKRVASSQQRTATEIDQQYKRIAYVQLPASPKKETAAATKDESVELIRRPIVTIRAHNPGLHATQPESERLQVAMQRAGGDEAKAKRIREDMQTDMDMIDAVKREDKADVEYIKQQRVQLRLQRAIADGRARRRVSNGETVMPSTEEADEEVLRESDWEVLEEDDLGQREPSLPPENDDTPGSADEESIIQDREIEEIADEEDDENDTDGESPLPTLAPQPKQEVADSLLEKTKSSMNQVAKDAPSESNAPVPSERSEVPSEHSSIKRIRRRSRVSARKRDSIYDVPAKDVTAKSALSTVPRMSKARAEMIEQNRQREEKIEQHRQREKRLAAAPTATAIAFKPINAAKDDGNYESSDSGSSDSKSSNSDSSDSD